MRDKRFAFTRVSVATAMVAMLLSACGPSKEERQRQAEVDSIAAAKQRGETDLSNPEMGSKVLITLMADSIQQSHVELPTGQVTFAVQNHDAKPHIFHIQGATSNWRTVEIPAQGSVLMAMVMQPGEYDMFCSDEESKVRDMCGPAKKIRLVGEKPQPIPSTTSSD